uniref:Uncharacterized protein n=1 Tax=Oryza brachyantha TaxID=4533 RepID=J3MMP3_ORYBR
MECQVYISIYSKVGFLIFLPSSPYGHLQPKSLEWLNSSSFCFTWHGAAADGEGSTHRRRSTHASHQSPPFHCSISSSTYSNRRDTSTVDLVCTSAHDRVRRRHDRSIARLMGFLTTTHAIITRRQYISTYIA